MLRLLTLFAVLAFAAPRASAADAKPLALEGHAAGVPAVVFIGDGKILATGSEDKTIKLWDAATGKELVTLKTGSVQSLASTADGRRFASAGHDGTVKVWDAATRVELLTLKGQKGDAAGLAFAPDGKTLAVGGGEFDLKAEKARGEIRLWDAAAGKELARIEWPDNRVTNVAFAPDGQTLAACSSNGAVALWDAATGKKVSDLGKNPNGATGLTFSPDGKLVACGNFFRELTIKVWDVATGKETGTISKSNNVSAFSLKFLPDGKTLAVGGFDQQSVRDEKTRGAYLALIAIDGKTERVLTGHIRGVTCSSVSRDGTRLAVSGLDKTARVWERKEK